MRAFFQVSMMFPVLTRPTRKSAQIRAKMRKNFKNHLDKGASACYNIACRSERIGYSSLAQSVERVTVNHDVVGSSPTGGAKEKTIRTGWSFLCFSYRCARKSLPVSHREIGGAQPPKASSLAAAAQTPSSPNRGSQRKDHPNRMVFFFASRIVAPERVCRFRIAPQVQYCTVCDSTRFHMRHHRIFHFFRLISPPILQKPFLKYIFVLQAAKNPTCFFFRSLYFLPQIRYTDIGK